MAELISRAAAIEYLMTNMGWHDEDGYEVDDADEKRKVITDLVNGIPAVDAVPVVHGRWTEEETSENTIDEWQSAKCTNCGKYHTTPYLYYFNDYKFCPHCGAKMDGERRENE